MDYVYFRIGDPAQPTLTKDEFGHDERKLAGLHVDSWDGLPLRHRHRSRNRLCINLGREPRYPLFINLPLMDMFRTLALRDPEDIYEDFRGLFLGQALGGLLQHAGGVGEAVDCGDELCLDLVFHGHPFVVSGERPGWLQIPVGFDS